MEIAVNRILSNMHKDDNGCWIPDYRYGPKVDGVSISPRRVLYEYYGGTIPFGCRLNVDCGNFKCINPDHVKDPYTVKRREPGRRKWQKPGRKPLTNIEPKWHPSIPTQDECIKRIKELTPRQVEVFEYLTGGYTFSQAARALGITQKTTQNTVNQAMEVLGVRPTLVAVALFHKGIDVQREPIEKVCNVSKEVA